jgi:hypothetical protein
MKAVEEAGLSGEEQTAPPGIWPTFSDPRFITFLRCWAERRRGLMQPRSSIDPATIKSCLPHVWLIQHRRQEGDFICTLAGEKVNEAWGQSVIGKPLTTFMPSDYAESCVSQYREIMQRPALLVSRRRINPLERSEKAAERLVAPLSDDEGRPYGVFGMTLYYFDPVTQARDVVDVTGETLFYNCADLPNGLPG